MLVTRQHGQRELEMVAMKVKLLYGVGKFHLRQWHIGNAVQVKSVGVFLCSILYKYMYVYIIYTCICIFVYVHVYYSGHLSHGYIYVCYYLHALSNITDLCQYGNSLAVLVGVVVTRCCKTLFSPSGSGAGQLLTLTVSSVLEP